MTNSRISAIHYCVPRLRLTNEELEERFGQRQVRSIVKMAGIKERRIAAPGQTAADLAYWATRRLVEDRKIDLAEIDLVIFASQTPDYQIPATACVLHGRLGLSDRCAAFDVNLGCTAYPYSLSIAHGLISTGVAKKALVINAETLTKVIHPEDRSLIPLHGDAAVVSLVEACPETSGFRAFLLGTDGTGYEHLIIPASGMRKPRTAESSLPVADESGIVRSQEHLYMNGPAIFHFSIHKIPEVINQALAQFNVGMEDLDLVVLHQANKTMVNQIYRTVGVPEEKQFYFMETVGNVSGPSLPLTLAEAWRQGRVRPRSKTLLVAFGVGLSWGVALHEWPEELPPAVVGPVEPEEEILP